MTDYSRLTLLKVKEIKVVQPYARYVIVLVEMDDRMWGTFNLHLDKTKFADDYDIVDVTYYLNKKEVQELLNDTLNEVNESLKLLEEK